MDWKFRIKNNQKMLKLRKYSPSKDTAIAKKVEQKEEITKTAPDSSERRRTIIVRHTSTETED